MGRVAGKPERNRYRDLKRQPQNGHSELLLRLVFQQNKGRVSVRPQSDKCAPDQQNQPVPGGGGLYGILDEKPGADA